MNISAHDISAAAKASKPSRKPRSSERFHLLHIQGGCEPSIVGKPYQRYSQVLKAARSLVNSDVYTEGEDNVFYVITKGRQPPKVCSFLDFELRPEKVDHNLE